MDFVLLASGPPSYVSSCIAGGSVQSEFYQLRRTAIKDVSAYCAFLLGFIGSAPFAWRYLSAQLESGAFVRGLWYFFALVTVAGLLFGIAGLALGALAGWAWEQQHRRRRSRRQRQPQAQARSGATRQAADGAAASDGPTVPATVNSLDSPNLRLVSDSTPSIPDLWGRKLSSIRFYSDRVELDFSGVLIVTADGPVVVAAMQRFRYPEASSRDALCSLIGATVEAIRTAPGDRLEFRFGADRQLIVSHPRFRSIAIVNRS